MEHCPSYEIPVTGSREKADNACVAVACLRSYPSERTWSSSCACCHLSCQDRSQQSADLLTRPLTGRSKPQSMAAQVAVSATRQRTRLGHVKGPGSEHAMSRHGARRNGRTVLPGPGLVCVMATMSY